MIRIFGNAFVIIPSACLEFLWHIPHHTDQNLARIYPSSNGLPNSNTHGPMASGVYIVVSDLYTVYLHFQVAYPKPTH
jgi:hypothetical protein